MPLAKGDIIIAIYLSLMKACLNNRSGSYE